MLKLSEKGLIQYVILILLALGLGAGLYLLSKGTIFKSKASNENTRIQVIDKSGTPIDLADALIVKLKIVYIPKAITTSSPTTASPSSAPTVSAQPVAAPLSTPTPTIVPTSAPVATSAPLENCRLYDEDVRACDAHGPYCAYYFCSEQCWPRGTSNQAAGCVQGAETSVYPKYFRVANCSTEQLNAGCLIELQKDKTLNNRTDWRVWSGGYQEIDGWLLVEENGKKYIFAQFSFDGAEWVETVSTSVTLNIPIEVSANPQLAPHTDPVVPTTAPSITPTTTPQTVAPQNVVTTLQTTPTPVPTSEFKDTCKDDGDCAPGTVCKTYTETSRQKHLACILNLK